MEAIGILKVKMDTQQVSEKFKKREFVLTDNGSKYPQHISFQLSQDKCDVLDGFNVGDEIKVQFNLQGREWTSPKNEIKYFNTLDAWKIEKLAAGSAPASTSAASAPAAKTNVQSTTSSSTFVASTGAEDDLPF